MPLVTFLTAPNLPIEDSGTPLVAAALAGLGVGSRTVVWSDSRAMAEPSDLVVIGTTWDYTTRVEEFLAALQSAPAPVVNPIDVVKWNAHKGYLVDLAAAGIPVVPTVLIRPGDVGELGVGPIILKPAISAGAHGVGRFDAADPAAQLHLEALQETGDVLMQPFRSEVLDGEVSLMYFGGEFSHAIRKVPAAADFRVQVEHGGSNRVHQPTTAELSVAGAAMKAIREDLLYARVDLIITADGPLLMELELIEPEMFHDFAPGSADRFAAAIAARLGGVSN